MTAEPGKRSSGKSFLMRHSKILILALACLVLFSSRITVAGDEENLFSTLESKKQFASEVSALIEKAWKKWQDSVLIEDIDVESSQGLLLPGDISRPVLTASSMLAYFDRKGKSQDYISCVKAVAGAVENGMRSWQRGYRNTDITFPQGASCTYTLPPCNNIPVTVASGRSSGDKEMTGDVLYSYMLYRAPKNEKEILIVFRGAAEAIAECFIKWKNSCSIVDILASGGIAPQPAPMGTGPGPVRGAKGQNGKLVGAYFNGPAMYNKMAEYFESRMTEDRG
jgi:hypothetical protein